MLLGRAYACVPLEGHTGIYMIVVRDESITDQALQEDLDEVMAEMEVDAASAMWLTLDGRRRGYYIRYAVRPEKFNLIIPKN